MCQQRHPLQFSHRQAKGAGGSSAAHALPSNGLHLCHWCHAFIEANPREAYNKGWKVRRGFDPREVAVWLRRRWFYLDDDGGLTSAEP